MNLMVLGNARHGKDTVCEILCAEFGLKFQSSSEFVAEKAVRPWLAAKGIVYPTYAEMYDDRVNHRADWFDAIAAYNHPDPTRLGRELYAEFDIYCGIRNDVELLALQGAGVIDFTIWVDAAQRLPLEKSTSIKVTRKMAEYVIDNNGALSELRPNVIAAYEAGLRAMRARAA